MKDLFNAANNRVAAAYETLYDWASRSTGDALAIAKAAHSAPVTEEHATLLGDLLYMAHHVHHGWTFRDARIDYLWDGAAVVIFPDARGCTFIAYGVLSRDLKGFQRAACALPEEMRTAFAIHASGVSRFLPDL